MAPQDEQLHLLRSAAVAASAHRFSLALNKSLWAVNSAQGGTPEQVAEIALADAACVAADQELAEYQASERWAPVRD